MNASMKRLLNGRAWYVAIFACLVLSLSLFGQGQGGAPSAGQGQGAAPAAGQKSAHQLEVERYEALHPTLPIGSTAPDFSVVDSQGKKHQLSDFKDSPILAIVFTCTHCPYAQLYEDRIQQLHDNYAARGVTVIAINPNAALAASPGELAWTDVDDSYENMAIRQKLRHLTYPYFYDGYTQAMAQAYGPKTTPHIFLFDKDRKLQYDGRIDDNMHEAEVKTHDARIALDEMLAGKPVTTPVTPAFGCSTKWADQIEAKQKAVKDWQAKPVNLEPATADTLKELRANSAGKTLVVAFYSVKCARCSAEFPGLITSYLWYKSRPFDLVTVSTDGPAAQADVQKLLDDQHSAVRNLQFASADASALQQAFAGKTWNTREPYTVVINPDGNLVYEGTKGVDDILRLRRTILANLDDSGNFRGNAAFWANNLRLEALEENR
jgi:peroxiredoxin